MINKTTKISHSAIRMYSECSKKYKLHYLEKIRPITTNGALIFGSALDIGLNTLLESRDLDASIKMFNKMWNFQKINNKDEILKGNVLVVYAERDFDFDLLEKEDIDHFNTTAFEFGYSEGISKAIKDLQDKKKSLGYHNMDFNDRRLLSLGNWLSMKRKGEIMLRSYHDMILPQIKNVLAIQKRESLLNEAGDQIDGIIDLIVELEDGNYIMDNKTSSIEYDDDMPLRSQQLILYYHMLKEEYNLRGAGFIVMYKTIIKNKTKVCEKCGTDGSGKSHRTCFNEANGVRCNGEWKVTSDPECRIQVIKNQIPEAAENLVLETFEQNNEGIKSGHFPPNLNACKNGNLVCPYFNLCWKGSTENLVDLSNK